MCVKRDMKDNIVYFDKNLRLTYLYFCCNATISKVFS